MDICRRDGETGAMAPETALEPAACARRPGPIPRSGFRDATDTMRASLLLLLIPGLALADDAALLRCRGVPDPSARLACYDALPLAATEAKAGQGVVSRIDQFGREALAILAPGTQTDAIESEIQGRFEGWGPNERIRLANGQVWQIADGSRGVHNINNPKVRVRRGAFGAYYIEFEGRNQSPRVTRVQ